MSASAQPISPARFALALRDLPVSSIYAKAHEISNSISHLERSNLALQQYSDELANDSSIPVEARSSGDKECLDAIQENDVVIARQRERITLLREEIERRGGRWHDADEEKNPEDGAEGGLNGQINGQISRDVETEDSSQQDGRGSGHSGGATGSSGGRLNDDELQRRLAERLDEDEDEGMHL